MTKDPLQRPGQSYTGVCAQAGVCHIRFPSPNILVLASISYRFAAVMWVAVARNMTLHVVDALLLTGAAVSYSIAAFRHQTYASSTITGGTGVSTIV